MTPVAPASIASLPSAVIAENPGEAANWAAAAEARLKADFLMEPGIAHLEKRLRGMLT